MVAYRLLDHDAPMETKVVTCIGDGDIFLSSTLGRVSLEIQIAIISIVTEEVGVAALLELQRCCKWMHHLIRHYMHPVLQEHACRFACRDALLDAGTTYKMKLCTEMSNQTTLERLKHAFSMMVIHCATPHCSVAIRSYNQHVRSMYGSHRRPRTRAHLRSNGSGGHVCGTIRVAYRALAKIAAAHHAPVAFLETTSHSPSARRGVVRVDAATSDAVWSPNSDMSVSVLPILRGEASASESSSIHWMCASGHGEAVLYGTCMVVQDVYREHVVKPFLWGCGMDEAVEMELPDGSSAETGWFKEVTAVKGRSLRFVLLCSHEDDEYVAYDMWEYVYDHETGRIDPIGVLYQHHELLFKGCSLSDYTHSVKGDWAACLMTRGKQTLAYMMSSEGDQTMISCCPIALLGGRFVIKKVTISTAGGMIAMLTSSRHDGWGVEVHKRVAGTSSCVRHIYKLYRHPLAGTIRSDTAINPLQILAFSPCDRFLLWCDADDLTSQALFALEVPHDAIHKDGRVGCNRINAVVENMPREMYWKPYGIWMCLQRGAVLLQS